jgi:hypothetical protein
VRPISKCSAGMASPANLWFGRVRVWSAGVRYQLRSVPRAVSRGRGRLKVDLIVYVTKDPRQRWK